MIREMEISHFECDRKMVKMRNTTYSEKWIDPIWSGLSPKKCAATGGNEETDTARWQEHSIDEKCSFADVEAKRR